MKVTVTFGLFPPGIADIDIDIGYMDAVAAVVDVGVQQFPAWRKVTVRSRRCASDRNWLEITRCRFHAGFFRYQEVLRARTFIRRKPSSQAHSSPRSTSRGSQIYPGL